MAGSPYDYDWNDPETARFYEAFCDRHSRYDEANTALIRNSALKPGLRVLDMAAGTGRTAGAALGLVGDGNIDCVEPAQAMRSAGQARMANLGVAWLDEMPDGTACYDRILCGAAIWQMAPLRAVFSRLYGLLAPDGLLVFNIPALYLGDPDPPGGGDDPRLLALPAAISEMHKVGVEEPEEIPVADVPSLTSAGIDQWLKESGFDSERWSTKSKFGQDAYRDWLKIPVLSNRLLPTVRADRRAQYIDDAYKNVDGTSWRWEVWYGWTARVRRP